MNNIMLQNASDAQISEELARRNGSYVFIRFQKPEIRMCEACGQWTGLKKKNELLCEALSAANAWLNELAEKEGNK